MDYLIISISIIIIIIIIIIITSVLLWKITRRSVYFS
jgi:hypothetical protein